MSTLTLWRDPFGEVDGLLRSVFPPARFTAARVRPALWPAAEVTRDGEDAVVRVELPGIDPSSDVTVEVDRGHLVVRGERRDERNQSDNGRSVREVRYGSFRRTFRLPEHVAAEALQASYDAGVLSVRIVGAYAGHDPVRVEVTSGSPKAELAEGDEAAGRQGGEGGQENVAA